MATRLLSDGDEAPRKADFVNYAPGFANRFMTLPGWRGMGIGVGTAMIIAIISGAFGTITLPWLERILFWVVTLGALALLWRAWFALVVRRSDQWARATWLGIFPLTLPLPLILSGALALSGRSLRGDWWQVWPSGLAIAGAAALAVFLLGLGVATAPRPAPKGRLFRHGITDPSRLRRAIAEDHYVRFLIDDGRSILVHERFADIGAELEALDGAFVRRGQWVAASEVAAVDRDGRRLVVRCRSGDGVPVSPAGREELKKRGWIR